MKTLKKPAYILKDTGRVHRLWAQLLLFGALFFAIAFAEAIVLLIIYALVPGTEGTSGVHDLFATLGSVALTLLYARALEKRSRPSLLLRLGKDTDLIGEYLLGLLSGASMLALVILFCVLTDGVRVVQNPEPLQLGTLALFFLGFMIQGFGEELLCRGYFMGGLMHTVSLPAAVLISSLGFTAIHFMNAGFALLGAVNITLFGVFAALFALKRGSLWAVSGMHTAWNFMEGCFFGGPVSGVVFRSSVLSCTFPEGRDLFNGGSFGLEGGLGTTVVLCLAIVFVLLFTDQKN